MSHFEPREPMDVLPIHALLGLWNAQLTNNNTEFRMIAETLGGPNLAGGAVVGLMHLLNRDGPDVNTGFRRLMLVAQQTIRHARHAQAHGRLPEAASVDAQNFAIEILTGTTIHNDGIALNINMPETTAPVATAMAVLIPMNIAAHNIVSGPGELPAFIETLRAEFWDIENRARSGGA
jgi:hypothetical protein